MKYITPKYEAEILEPEDILLASSEKYAIEEANDGSGNIIIDASDVF